MSKIVKKFTKESLSQISTLITGAFGFVAALAWNNFIQELINAYIRPLIGGASGIVSLFIYSILVTILAIVVTINLTRLTKS